MDISADWAIAIVTFGLLIITLMYAYFTMRILRANVEAVEAMRTQTRTDIRPFVNIYADIDPVSALVRLKIENIGKTPARNMSLKVDRSFFQFAKKIGDIDIADFHIFNSKVETFAPGAKISYNLVFGRDLNKDNYEPSVTPYEFEIKAEYEAEEKYVETTVVDLRPFLKTALQKAPLETELNNLALELRKIERQLNNLVVLAKAKSTDQRKS